MKVLSERLSIVSHTKGDSNGDGFTDIADVVNTANYVLGKEVSTFNKENADVNTDGRITVSDVTGTVSLILGVSTRGDNLITTYSSDENNTNDGLEIGELSWFSEGVSQLPVYLNGIRDYAAIQFDMVIEGNVEIVNLRLDESVSQTHELAFAPAGDGVYRAVIFDLESRVMQSNESPLVYIDINNNLDSSGAILLTNVVASDSEANRYSLVSTRSEGIETASVTSIDEKDVEIVAASDGVVIMNAKGKAIMVVSAEGISYADFIGMNSDEKVLLTKGLYLVKAGEKTMKLIVR